MDFSGFTLSPSQKRREIASSNDQRVVGEVLERFGLIERLPSYKILRVELENAVPEGVTLSRAHETWSDTFFLDVTTPAGFPRQDASALTPPGIVKVSVECINQATLGMGSHFGFKGYYLSVLVSLADRAVWDARGQPAT